MTLERDLEGQPLNFQSWVNTPHFPQAPFPRVKHSCPYSIGWGSVLTQSSKYWLHYTAKLMSSRKSCWLHPTGTLWCACFIAKYHCTVGFGMGPNLSLSCRHYPSGWLHFQGLWRWVCRVKEGHAVFSLTTGQHHTQKKDFLHLLSQVLLSLVPQEEGTMPFRAGTFTVHLSQRLQYVAWAWVNIELRGGVQLTLLPWPN